MTRIHGVCALALLLALACHHPSHEPGADAGSGGLPAVELRAALLLAYPEFRGARVTGGEAALIRVFDAPELAVKDAPTVAPPFQLTREAAAGHAVWKLSLPLNEAVVSRLYSSNRTLTTEDFARRLPKSPGPFQDRFVLELHYEATPERAGFMEWQLLHGLLLADWRTEDLPPGWAREDSGFEPVENQQAIRLERQSDGAVFTVQRDGGAVSVRYEQPLRAGR